MSEMLKEMKQFRLDRMRLGQEAPDFVEIPSMPDYRVALVPITEGDYDEALQMSSLIEAPDNPAGYIRRDRRANGETLIRSIRNPNNLEERLFQTIDDMHSVLEVSDVNFLTDRYMEMISRSSPNIDGFTDEELDEAKKALQTIDWSVLSGRSWYALRRFLFSVGQPLQPDKSPGRSSTSSSTMTNGAGESTPTA